LERTPLAGVLKHQLGRFSDRTAGSKRALLADVLKGHGFSRAAKAAQCMRLQPLRDGFRTLQLRKEALELAKASTERETFMTISVQTLPAAARFTSCQSLIRVRHLKRALLAVVLKGHGFSRAAKAAQCVRLQPPRDGFRTLQSSTVTGHNDSPLTG